MNWKTMTCLGVVMLLCSSYARAGDEPVKPALTTVSASPAETVAYGDEAGPRDGQCLSGGCSNFTSNYPSGTFSTTSSFFTTVSTCIYGGEFAYYSVVAGETYEWSLCSADGGSCAFDSQLTLTSADGATAYCYSDDHCGDDAKIMWTASFTGTVRVLLSKYNCADQNTCTTLVWRCASCGVTCVPDYAVTAPYTSPLRNTCTPAVSDCTLRPSPEHIYEVTIPSSGDWKFSLCPGPGTFDTYMYLGTSCCGGTIASNDDACAPESEITALGLSAGIYYVTVEGYYSSSPSWCGDYILEITQLVPCAVNCEPGDVSESEPGCGVGYVDAWNGGCNSTPAVFQPIDCGQTICGTSGTWMEGTINYRDTDWYSVTTTQPTIFTWSAVAEFPLLIFVIDGTCGCGGYTVVSSATAAECVTASITTACLPPGTYWFWVGPSAFTGVACGAEYRATLSCTPCTPPTSLPGETCAVAIPIPALPFTDSGTTVGYANNYDYACPYTGSTSPDVVYAYTPAVNEALKINLCDSEYDTKVYVYEDLCCNPPIACNDDDTTVCTLAYRSYLTCVPVQAGHTY